MRSRHGLLLVVVVGVSVVTTAGPVAAGGAVTSRVSVSSAGEQADQESWGGAVSGDGRYVAFVSAASNLVAGDTNGSEDVFVRDLRTRTTSRVSVSTGGMETDAGTPASEPAISHDGRYVAFTSSASNLVPGDTNERGDVFVRDLWTGTTTRSSVTSAGAEANNTSYEPAISADGRYVVFLSHATNLLAVEDTNDTEDVFVRDRWTGTTERISVSSSGAEANGRNLSPAVSADGRYVAFGSFASNLVPDASDAGGIFVRDLWAGTTTRASLTSTGFPATSVGMDTSISANGRYVTFYTDAPDVVPGDTNNMQDGFLRDRWTGTTSRISLSSTEAEANDNSALPAISADGRYVVFISWASNLVRGDGNGVSDIFVRDRAAGTTRRISVSSTGTEANDASGDNPAISADGRYVVFVSWASNLVRGDTNHLVDVFVRPRAG